MQRPTTQRTGALALVTALACTIPTVASGAPTGATLALRAAPSRSAIPEAAWTAMHEQEVELVLADDTTVTGKLIAQDSKSVTLIAPDRAVVVVAKSKVAGLRVAEASAAATDPATPPPLPPATAAVAPPPQPSSAAAASVRPPAPIAGPGVSTGDGCVGLDCVTGPSNADSPETNDKQVERAGLWTLVGGASTLGLGLILVGAGIGAGRAAVAESCGTYGDCTVTPKLVAAARTTVAGYAFVGMGATTTIIGGIVYGVAHARVKRAKAQLGFTPLPRGAGLSLSGRF